MLSLPVPREPSGAAPALQPAPHPRFRARLAHGPEHPRHQLRQLQPLQPAAARARRCTRRAGPTREEEFDAKVGWGGRDAAPARRRRDRLPGGLVARGAGGGLRPRGPRRDLPRSPSSRRAPGTAWPWPARCARPGRSSASSGTRRSRRDAARQAQADPWRRSAPPRRQRTATSTPRPTASSSRATRTKACGSRSTSSPARCCRSRSATPARGGRKCRRSRSSAPT